MTIRLALCLVVAGCSGRAAPPPEGGPTPTVGEPQPPATTDGGDAGAASPLGAVRVTPLPPPPPPERMPKLVFLAPKPSEAIPLEKADAFEVRLDVKDWFVSPGDHVHLVLDDKPYKALGDPRSSLKLGDVFPGEPLAEGQHVLAAFPARDSHLTVKPHDGKSPLAVVTFWVGKPGKAGWKATDPALFSSRPKGTYNGTDADAVLLDFYVHAVALGEGRASVRARVSPPSGEPVTVSITTWAPWSIENLPSGTTRVLLELLDKEGAPMPGPLSRIEREISVNRDAR